MVKMEFSTSNSAFCNDNHFAGYEIHRILKGLLEKVAAYNCWLGNGVEWQINDVNGNKIGTFKYVEEQEEE